MDNTRLYKYYRRQKTRRFPFIGFNLERLFNFDPSYDIVTILAYIFITIIAICSMIGLSRVTSNEKVFRVLQEETEKKVPRKKSIAAIRPTYNCIHKHLQQTNVFQEKTKKTLCKEQLELEILNSKINCISKLLKPEMQYSLTSVLERYAQSEWRRSRSPKVYHRPVSAEGTK